MSTEPGLHVSPDLTLPLNAVTETLAFLAMRRAGKTNAAVAMAEEMFANGLPWVALDPVGSWWGIRAAGSGPGLPVLVFGGEHGDVPLDPTTGRVVADLVIDHNLTCVIDVSLMDDDEELPLFVTAFLTQLFRRNRDPRHLFMEEADVVLPQVPSKETRPMLRAGTKLIKLGGARGLGCSLITQRSASLNKNALAQVGTLIALRTTWPADQDAVLRWMKSHSAGVDIVDALPQLVDGEAFVCSPDWLGRMIRVRFRRRKTYDSGATPKVGQTVRPPTDLASIDLGALRQAMATIVEKAAEDDPEALHARIRTLERELAEAQDAARGGRIATLEGALSAIRFVLIDAAGSLTSIAAKIEALHIGPSPATAPDRAAPAQVATPPMKAQPAPPAPRAPSLGPPPDGAGAPTHLRTGARRMVEALGRMHPLRLTTSQWGTLAHLKTTGGTWSTYLSDIRRAGFIDENAAGYTLTDAGFDYLGGQPELMSPQELQDHYRGILRTGAVKMLDALIAAYPGGLTRDELGAAADIAVTGGTFSTYLSDLTRNGLAERNNGSVRATPILMGDTR